MQSAENERQGARVEYVGVDRETSTFVYLRSYADESDRQVRKDAFYSSAWWIEREAFAMTHVIEYEVTFLDAVIVREGPLIHTPWPAPGVRAGSNPDGPPEGWVTSTRTTFVPG